MCTLLQCDSYRLRDLTVFRISLGGFEEVSLHVASAVVKVMNDNDETQ